jgi:predicted GIY-YIG superfamily endonuclease
MAARDFDIKFGKAFLETIPECPGVYRMFDDQGNIIYVGKAKNLRRRLAQYRNAKRKKKDRKMRSIVADARRIEWEPAETDLDASLREMRAIQSLRPKWNVVGTFTFMYPMLGMAARGADHHFCLTTLPAQFGDFRLYGAFRSRELTGEAFFGLMRLLKYLGHPERPSREELPAHSYVFSFRRLPEGLPELWDRFFRGESKDALEDLLLRLLMKPGARAQAADVQADIDALKRFWKKEAKVLREAIVAQNYTQYPVPQTERDPLFLFYRRKEV